jgi:hypothetical protein
MAALEMLAAFVLIVGGALARWALPRRRVGVLPVCARAR